MKYVRQDLIIKHYFALKSCSWSLHGWVQICVYICRNIWQEKVSA